MSIIRAAAIAYAATCGLCMLGILAVLYRYDEDTERADVEAARTAMRQELLTDLLNERLADWSTEQWERAFLGLAIVYAFVPARDGGRS